MTSGVTDSGFVKKTLPEILAEIAADEKALISASLNTLPSSIIGQINGIVADKLRELWDVAEAIYRAFQPDYASGDSLDHIMAITGAKRLAAAKSRIIVDRLLLADGVTLTAGSMISVGVSGARFELLADLSNATGFSNLFSAEFAAIEYGSIPAFAQTLNNIVTPIVGWTAQAAMKTAVAEMYAVGSTSLILIPDEDVSKQETINFPAGGPYTAQECADFINADASYSEAYDANGYLLVVSVLDGVGSAIKAKDFGGSNANLVFLFPTTAVVGMNSIDATLGRDTETDVDARIRREELLQVSGSATVDAIRAAVRALDYIVQCLVIENTTDGPVDGLPAHSFETIAFGGTAGDEQEIAETIFGAKPAGIQAYGSISKTVTDSQSLDHVVGLSRPTEVPIYIALTVTAYADDFPTDGEDQIKEALKALGDSQQIGQDVIALQYNAAPLGIAGTEDVTAFVIDDADPPVSSTNISIATRELATVALADIDLTMVWL